MKQTTKISKVGRKITLTPETDQKLRTLLLKQKDITASGLIEKLLNDYFERDLTSRLINVNQKTNDSIESMEGGITEIRAQLAAIYRLINYTSRIIDGGLTESYNSLGEKTVRPNEEQKRVAHKRALKDMARLRVNELDREDFLREVPEEEEETLKLETKKPLIDEDSFFTQSEEAPAEADEEELPISEVIKAAESDQPETRQQQNAADVHKPKKADPRFAKYFNG